MQSFDVDSGSPEAFTLRMREAMVGRALGSIATVTVACDELVLTVSRLGTSEVRFRTTPSGTGFRAVRSGEKIALPHRPFREEMERKLEGVVRKAGGRPGR